MTRAFGLDISKYQAPQDLDKAHGIDFEKMLSMVDFLFVRAGYAGSATKLGHEDERVREYMADLVPLLKKTPIPFSFYWYFRDDASISSQATVFARLVNEFKEVVNLSLVCDAEIFELGVSLSTSKLRDFRTEVIRLTGLDMDVIYGRGGQLNAETSPGVNLFFPHLWVARYDTSLDPQTGEPWVEGGPQEYVEPRDWDEWRFWQYTSSGEPTQYGVSPYGGKTIDENVANMTCEELYKLANIVPVTPEPPLPEPEPNIGWSATEETKSGAVRMDFRLKPVADSCWLELLSLAFGKESVDKVNVAFIIDGVSFPYKTYSARYANFIFVDLPHGGLTFRPTDEVYIQVYPLKQATVSVKVAWD